VLHYRAGDEAPSHGFRTATFSLTGTHALAHQWKDMLESPCCWLFFRRVSGCAWKNSGESKKNAAGETGGADAFR